MFFQPDLLHTRDQVISSVLAGAKGLTWLGAAPLSLTGANTLSGPLNIKGGNLTIGAGGAAGRLGNGVFNGTTTVAAGSVFNWNSTLAQTFLGAINGPGSMVVSVFANIGMATSNSISGGITMLSGNLSANGSSTQNTIWGTGPLVIGAAAFWSLQGWNSLGGATGPSSLALAGSCGTATGTAANLPATTPVTITASTATFNCSAAGALSVAGTVNLQSFSPNLVAVSAGMAINISGAISGTGGLNKNTGAGTATLSGANTFTGGMTNTSSGQWIAGIASVPNVSGAFGLNCLITSGNFAGNGYNLNGFNTQIGSATGGGSSGGGVVLGAATLTTGADNANQTLGGTINGTGGVSKIGTGTQTLTNTANSYTGATSITGGSLAVGGAGRLNSGAYAGAIAISSGCTLAIGTTAAQTLSGIISGAGAPVKSNTGVLGLTGVNTYTGDTSILGGNLTIGGAGSLGSGNYAGAINNAGLLVVSTTSAQTLSGVISGVGALTKSTSASVLMLTGTNTYTGATTLTLGSVSVATIGNGGNAGNLGAATNAASNLVFGGGTLLYTGATDTTDRNYTLNAATTGAVNVAGAAVLTWAGSSTATTGALNKLGTGTILLNGANLHTGVTTLSAGSLGGTGSLAGALTIVSATHLFGGLGTGSNGTLTVSGALSFPTGSILDVYTNGSTNSKVAVMGTVTAAGSHTVNILNGLAGLSTFTLINNAGATPAGTWTTGTNNAGHLLSGPPTWSAGNGLQFSTLV